MFGVVLLRCDHIGDILLENIFFSSKSSKSGFFLLKMSLRRGCLVEEHGTIVTLITYTNTKHIEGVMMPLSSNIDDDRDYRQL